MKKESENKTKNGGIYEHKSDTTTLAERRMILDSLHKEWASGLIEYLSEAEFEDLINDRYDYVNW